MRRWALIVATAAAIVAPAGPSEARPQEVEVRRDRFAPAQVRVGVDETVRWVIREEHHTITSEDGLFDSGRAGPGSIYVARFHNAGRYAYYCSIHGGPGGQGMSGVVVVRDQRREAASEESPTTTAPPPPTPPPPGPPPTTSPPPPSPSPLPTPATPTAEAAAAPTTTTTKPPPVTTTTTPAPTTTTAATTVPPAPESTTTTASPPPPATPTPPPPADRYAAGPVPEVPDPPGRGDLHRIVRETTQRRLASASRDSGDERGRDALVVVGGGLLVIAGLVLVVPGWRTRRL